MLLLFYYFRYKYYYHQNYRYWSVRVARDPQGNAKKYLE